MHLGAGGQSKEDIIDHAVGIDIHKKVGDEISVGDLIARIMYNDDKNLEQVKKMINEAVIISKEEIDKIDVIDKIIK